MIRTSVALALLICITLWCGFAPLSVQAADGDDYTFHVRLIWGTDGDKPRPKPGKKPLKDVEPEMREKLASVFKWKNYFEVNRKELKVAAGETQSCRIDEPCKLELTNHGNSVIEVKLIGKGKAVFRQKQIVNRGEPVVFGGPEKNDTAWFVVLIPK